MLFQFHHPWMIFHLVEWDGFQSFDVRICLLHTHSQHIRQPWVNPSLQLPSPSWLALTPNVRSTESDVPAFLFHRAFACIRLLHVSCGKIATLFWSFLLQTSPRQPVPPRLPAPSVQRCTWAHSSAFLASSLTSWTRAPSAEGRVRPCVRP